ncbi:MAG: hypothetical protein ACRDRS_10335 [Pseudonocardiaceae bacterium]
MSWYLRSMGDRDTHRAGLLHPDGTLTAACGVRFRPREFLRGTTALCAASHPTPTRSARRATPIAGKAPGDSPSALGPVSAGLPRAPVGHRSLIVGRPLAGVGVGTGLIMIAGLAGAVTHVRAR